MRRLKRTRRRAAPPALRRAAPLAGTIVPGTLLALAGLHASWALGCRWPGGSDGRLAEYVLSRAERERLMQRTGRELPSAPMTWAVAGVLLAAAASVRAAASGVGSRPARLASWTVCGVLFSRGAQGIVAGLTTDVRERYERFDLTLYSPLCLALAGGTAMSARRAR